MATEEDYEGNCPECNETVDHDDSTVGYMGGNHQCSYCGAIFDWVDAVDASEDQEPDEEQDQFATLRERLELFIANVELKQMAADNPQAVEDGLLPDDADNDEWLARATAHLYAFKNKEAWEEIAAFLDEAEDQVGEAV